MAGAESRAEKGGSTTSTPRLKEQNGLKKNNGSFSFSEIRAMRSGASSAKS